MASVEAGPSSQSGPYTPLLTPSSASLPNSSGASVSEASVLGSTGASGDNGSTSLIQGNSSVVGGIVGGGPQLYQNKTLIVAVPQNLTRVDLAFSYDVGTTTALLPGTYTISGGVSVVGVVKNVNGTISLFTTPMQPGLLYTVNVSPMP